MRGQYPQLAAAAWSGEEPLVRPIDVRSFHSVSQSFRCRGGGGSNAVPMLDLASALRAMAQNDQMLAQMEQFATFMLDGMANVQETQNKMLVTVSAPDQSLALPSPGCMQSLTNCVFRLHASSQLSEQPSVQDITSLAMSTIGAATATGLASAESTVAEAQGKAGLEACQWSRRRWRSSRYSTNATQTRRPLPSQGEGRRQGRRADWHAQEERHTPEGKQADRQGHAS